MLRFKRISRAIVFSLLTLTTILLIFEEHVVIPYWLEPLGRLHPLTLHFPVAFIVLLVILSLFKKSLDEPSFEKIHTFLLSVTALTTAIAVIMGFFLHLEGYGSTSMAVHKWTGLALGYLCYVLLLTNYSTWLHKGVLYISFVTVIVAGHYGANLTHGSDFITQPLTEAKEQEFDVAQPLFSNMVQPILKSKCVSCHNPDKHKGGLDLSSLASIEKGGDNGPLWLANNVDESAIIQRALLPIEHEDHMPPEGKTQLSAQDLALLKAWIGHGANPEVALAEVSDQDSLYSIASQIIEKFNSGPEYSFGFADKKTLEQLNSPFRNVIQKSISSPAIEATIFGRSTFKIDYLKELSKIKEQLTHLNLSNLPISDNDLKLIAQFENLELLNLNNTDITNESIQLCSSFKNLTSLSLSGTSINEEVLNDLESIETLSEVYLWNTSITDSMLIPYRKSMPEVNFELGYVPSAEDKSKLTPPVLPQKKHYVVDNEKIILEHKFKGVQVRYTTDGSEPDSLSTVYSEPFPLGDSKIIKTYAHKEGWKDSEVQTFEFINKGHVPVDVKLKYNPPPNLSGKGALTLIDDIKGNDWIDPLQWIGFSEKPLHATMDFGANPPETEKIIVSYGIREYGEIVPPKNIEVWSGNNKDSLTLLLKKNVSFAKSDAKGRKLKSVEFSFNKVSHRFYTIKAEAYDKLPNWHKKSGKPGWLAVDQILFH
ncbi:chitobiase/beta-hexosaminidase C-terminal domain-containing protein [Flagellimonas sp.]|uniref:chitobiase/beta-hexosaminidase C-terminal domain-containing protein n=1 Tax=Flagellimonas sp. TaxID=2058762 RepID=UPI003B527307